ncbi:protein GAMETOPHYTE DEFECTIVE 1 [Rhododendron vialii]|uniref:protein GAMETOPHYTE DEFECTIVE 1 n=1 Tax=Rhododendron vialii TaxID=182163 RepID=UPI00265EF4F8|nr:protein GAMETOPHYTE DEFECTIVE 1 [Rhododendron vialii]
MVFFDLNIPYHESDKHVPDKSARKTTRLKLAVKAMELGYTGVAYNRTIKGVMSEHDRCATPKFPLSSVLKLAPSLSSAVKLHRHVLGVPASAPFRQYTRLTVVVDSSAQVAALNSGNPILKTYDVVAVKPLSQNAFEQACKASEVDLIAIDFSEKLPFRLKQRLVKDAIERGVSFEITYSRLIMDAQVRRQMISNAKLLVDWTRGKNLIVSSAASSVTELRGPYDVANLSSLLGLSMEHAKAALSKNCRSLIANATRKKQFYKEAIRVEVIPSGEQLDSKESCLSDWLKWDPISSGEGDLLLDDMAKSFSASSKVSKTVKAIDFAAVVDSLPSRGLQVCDLKSTTEAAVQPLDVGKNLSAVGRADVPIVVTGVSQQLESLEDLAKADQTSSYNMPSQHFIHSCEDSMDSFSPTTTMRHFDNAEEILMHTANSEEEPKNSNGLDVDISLRGTEVHNLQSQSCITHCDAWVFLPDSTAEVHTSAMETEIASTCNAIVDVENPTPCKDLDFSAFPGDEAKISCSSDGILGVQDHGMEEGLIGKNANSKVDLSSASHEVCLHEDFMEREQFRETRDDSVFVADGLPAESYREMEDSDDHPAENCEPPDEVVIEDHKRIDIQAEVNCPASNDSSGKGKVKPRRRIPSRAFSFPLKRLLNPAPFKRKAQKLKTKTKLL